MGLSVADQYYLKATSSYPYDMEETLEQLNYALSCDPEHCQANCLMGRIFMYHLKQYDQAEYYFNQSIQSDMNYPESFKYLAVLNIWTGEYEKALKIMTYAFKIKGMNQCELLSYKALIYECTGRLSDCEVTLEKALDICLDPRFEEAIQKQVKRVKLKRKRLKKRRKKAKASQKRNRSVLKPVV